LSEEPEKNPGTLNRNILPSGHRFGTAASPFVRVGRRLWWKSFSRTVWRCHFSTILYCILLSLSLVCSYRPISLLASCQI